MKVFYLFFVFVFSKDEHAAEQIVPRGKPDPRGKRGCAAGAAVGSVQFPLANDTAAEKEKREREKRCEHTPRITDRNREENVASQGRLLRTCFDFAVAE